jgi:hypothetical protein
MNTCVAALKTSEAEAPSRAISDTCRRMRSAGNTHVDTCNGNGCHQYTRHCAASLTSKSSDVIDDATRLISSELQERACNV